jgi:hypothetical protein
MTSETYTLDHAHAAMCLWEEIIDPTLKDAGAPWAALREQVGSAELRHMVLQRLAVACADAWQRADAAHDAAYTTWAARKAECERMDIPFYDAPPVGCDGFDYEFVPFWIRNCVDWSDVLNGPRVLGEKKL